MDSCNKKEKYVCSNVNCELRICNECYKNFPEDEITICMPVTENNDNNSNNESHTSDNSNVMEVFNDTTDVEVSDECNIVEEMANLVVSPEQDISLDQTEDNMKGDTSPWEIQEDIFLMTFVPYPFKGTKQM